LGAPLDVYTLGFEDPSCDETAAGTLADLSALPLRVHQWTLSDDDFAAYPQATWHSESPTTSGVEVPRWALGRETGGTHRVALAGEGSDEIFGGYWWYRIDRWVRPLARLPRVLRRAALVGPLAPERRPWGAGAVMAPLGPPLSRFEALTGPRGAAARSQLYSADFRARVEAAVHDGPRPEDALGASPPPRDPFDRLLWVEMKTRLPDYIEQRVDRLSMAHAVEVRLPFLDHEIVEFAARIPPRLKLHGRTEKHILRLALDGIVPEVIRHRRKHGLGAPFRRWLRGPLPTFAADLLSAGTLRRKGYFDPTEITGRLARHRAGVEDEGEALMGVLAIQTWDEVFLAGRRP
jgi:asparagine synthase (glutamine-hydrolysing)